MRKILESGSQYCRGIIDQVLYLQLSGQFKRVKLTPQKGCILACCLNILIRWSGGVVFYILVHPRFKFILWLAVQNRLATVEMLLKYGIHVPPDCGSNVESFDHLYFECLTTRTLWRKLFHWMGINRSIQDWQTEQKQVCMLTRKKAGRAKIILCVCYAYLHYLA